MGAWIDGRTDGRMPGGQILENYAFRNPLPRMEAIKERGGERSRLLPRSQRDNSCCKFARQVPVGFQPPPPPGPRQRTRPRQMAPAKKKSPPTKQRSILHTKINPFSKKTAWKLEINSKQTDVPEEFDLFEKSSHPLSQIGATMARKTWPWGGNRETIQIFLP